MMPPRSQTSKQATPEHAEYSPSKAEIWFNCTAAIPTISRLGIKSNSSAAAELGTAAHSLLDSSLKSWKHPSTFRGKIFNGYKVDSDMINAVAVAYEYAADLKANGWKIYAERKVAIKCTGEFGTIDITAVKGDDIIIADYKHGKGVPVEAKQNKQMRLYLLGIIDEHELRQFIRNAKLVIIQPRCKPEPEEYIEELRELWKFERTVAARIEEAKSGKGKFNPTDKGCLWCPLANQCKARALQVTKAVGIDFDTLEAPKCEVMSETEFLRIFNGINALQQWIKSIYSLAFDKAKLSQLDGWKVVEGDSKRKWEDEAKVAKALAKMKLDIEEYMPRKLAGLTVISDLIGNKHEAEQFLKKFTVRGKGEPILVPDTDKRPAINPADDFISLPEE